MKIAQHNIRKINEMKPVKLIARAKSIAAALLVVGCLSGLSVASASAAEPYFEGVSEKNPVSITFSGSGVALETANEFGNCKQISGEGVLTGARTGHAVLKASECGNLPHFCHDVGSNKTLTTVELEIVPVYINKATHTVGLWFKPKSGTQFAKLGCTFSTGELVGGLITGEIAHEKKSGKSFPFQLNGFNGTQTPSQFETEAGVVQSWLEIVYNGTGSITPESWSSSLTMTAAKEIRIVGL